MSDSTPPPPTPPVDGVIKFRCELSLGSAWDSESCLEFSEVRRALHTAHLIGVDPEGIGFGNLSVLLPQATGGVPFVISASATGGLAELGVEDVCRVERVWVADNRVACIGSKPASSETMTHAVAYETERARAVVHVHHAETWRRLLGVVPSTPADVPYGTPEMAEALRTLLLALPPDCEQTIAMGGHPDGLLFLAASLESAARAALRTCIATG